MSDTCTDPDCHANAFAAAHGDACPDPSAHERIGDAIAAAVQPIGDPDLLDSLTDAEFAAVVCTLSDFDSNVTAAFCDCPAHRQPDPHADDDPTADTAY